MFSLLRSVRPCSKRICGCYDRALKLSLYLPIDKDDEIENDKKKDELRRVHNICMAQQGWKGHLKSYYEEFKPHN